MVSSSYLSIRQLLNHFKWNSLLIILWYLVDSRWYAKRFLHPAIVDCYEYIFIWDEDLGLEHFDAEKWESILFVDMVTFLCHCMPCDKMVHLSFYRYIELVKKHGLEISQPGVQSERKILWQLTKKRNNSVVHKSIITTFSLISITAFPILHADSSVCFMFCWFIVTEYQKRYQDDAVIPFSHHVLRRILF